MAVPRGPRAAVRELWAQTSKSARAVTATLARWDGAEDEDRGDGQPPPRDWLHRWLPFAIVLVSVGAGAAGWQASVADERATRHDEVSRQDLVRLTQVKLAKVQSVDADLQAYGRYERHALLATELRRDARRATQPLRGWLADEARTNRLSATSLLDELEFGGALPDTREPYDATYALVLAETGDADLSSVEPNRQREEARDQRTMGLHLTGLAVLCIVGLVFFTLAAVTRGRRAYAFAGLGTSVAIVAAGLFPLVRWV
jgi:hypothetical protein